MIHVVICICFFMFGFWSGYRWCMDEEAELRRRKLDDTDIDIRDH